ncbi:MAG: DMT family transporter [Anaerolineae bacterium]|jgi:drug/metabolite transporter (DMT)-like permease|nr:DMT family transporter [Anaerolineae bacterium]MBT7074291.1 DMT family transporter [Anaerolineae bacterium]MBT7782248.1 DMT family transporter [Anaerolineae bacterium]
MRFKANAALFLVALIWGASFITQDIAAQYHFAYLFNSASFLLGGLVLLPFAPRKHKIPREQWKWMFVAGIVLFFASTLQQVGIFYTQIANAGFLTSLYIVFIPFILWLSFRERPHWVDALSVGMAIIGAYLLSTAGIGFQIQLGDGLEILGAVFWGMHVVILGKFATKYEPISFASGQFLITGVITLFLGLVLEEPAQFLVPPIILAAIYRGLLAVGIGYTLQVWSQNYIPSTSAGLILSLESVFAALFAWIILGQNLLPIQIAGCVVILLAVLFSQFKKHFTTSYK